MWPTDYPTYFDDIQPCSNDHCEYSDGTCFEAGKCLKGGDIYDD